MIKYKLINIKTKEEHLCDKITIDGFDYYVSDEKIKELAPDDRYATIVENPRRIVFYTKHVQSKDVVVIATNNPNIDIFKVVDEVEELALKTTLHPKVLFEELKKCSQNDALLIDEFGEYNIVRYRETTGFILGYNKSQETHPFSEEDMVLFGDWLNKNASRNNVGTWGYFGNLFYTKTTKELLQLWKEQQPKVLFYES